MPGPLHAGELELQQRYGVAEMGGRVAASIRRTIPPVAKDFLTRQGFAVAAVIDPEARPWAALWAGDRGFLEAVDDVTLRAPTRSLDPLSRDRVQWPGRIGLLAIDLASRRRMRINGQGRESTGDGFLEIRADEVYSNCPKYIQKRVLEPVNQDPGEITRGLGLSERQWRWIEGSDTFFIATFHPQTGADASHRGGPPGFVRRQGDQALEFADYAGNNLFNSLGNLHVYPRIGLLFVDFESGDTLQLTGRAQLLHRAPDVDEPAGSQGRIVRVEIEEWQQQRQAMAWRGSLVEPSPFNP